MTHLLPLSLHAPEARSGAGWTIPRLALIYAVGIAMVHAREGWFVVGAGRNGAEYSVLLIVCLLCVGLQHVQPRQAA